MNSCNSSYKGSIGSRFYTLARGHSLHYQHHLFVRLCTLTVADMILGSESSFGFHMHKVNVIVNLAFGTATCIVSLMSVASLFGITS